MKGLKGVYTYSLIAALVLVAVATHAFAAAPASPTTAWMPKAAKAACTTIGPSRAGTASLAVTDTRLISWKAFDAANGNAVVVKRKLATGNTAYMPGSSEGPIGTQAGGAAITFVRYTGATTVTICYDKD